MPQKIKKYQFIPTDCLNSLPDHFIIMKNTKCLLQNKIKIFIADENDYDDNKEMMVGLYKKYSKDLYMTFNRFIVSLN